MLSVACPRLAATGAYSDDSRLPLGLGFGPELDGDATSAPATPNSATSSASMEEGRYSSPPTSSFDGPQDGSEDDLEGRAAQATVVVVPGKRGQARGGASRQNDPAKALRVEQLRLQAQLQLLDLKKAALEQAIREAASHS